MLNPILMKGFLSHLFALNAVILCAQIPNAGFESWHYDTAGSPLFVYQEPDDWFTYNSTDAFYSISSVLPESNAHSGNLAAKIQAVQQGAGVYAGVLTLINLNAPNYGGAPITQKYNSFSGWLNYQTQGDDSVYIIAHLFRNTTGIKSIVAEARGIFAGTQTSYAQFTLPFHYYLTTMPDSIDILFVVGEQSSQGFQFGTLGSSAVVDELSLNAIPAYTPNSPTGLIAAALKVQDNNGIRLDWDDNSSNETGFVLERSLERYSGFVSIDILDSGTTSFTDTGLIDNTTYYYQIFARNANGDSPRSNVALATTKISTGIADFSFEEKILICPNPAGETVNIILPAEISDAHITILNLLGQTVVSYENSSPLKADISKLPAGNYVVRIVDDSMIVNRKLSVQ